MRLLIAFIAVPLIEIGIFIQVGDTIGLWPTLFIVLLTAIVGTALVRSQGAQGGVQYHGIEKIIIQLLFSQYWALFKKRPMLSELLLLNMSLCEFF